SAVDELYVVSATPGSEPRRITMDNAFISAHVWSDDGSELVFSSKRSGAMALWRMSLASGAVRRIPGIGSGAYYLASSRQKHRLAYSEWSVDTNIWRAAIPSRAGEAGDNGLLIDSTLEDVSPQYSPDGKKVVFRSNRSGSDEIWTANADGSNPVRLT